MDLGIASRTHEVQCLKFAHGLINQESKWTKGAHARLANGSTTNWWNWKATQFSLYGALRRCCNLEEDFSAIAPTMQKFISMFGDFNLISFNDDDDISYNEIIQVIELTKQAILPELTEERIGKIWVDKAMKAGWNKDKAEAAGLSAIEYVYYLGYIKGRDITNW